MKTPHQVADSHAQTGESIESTQKSNQLKPEILNAGPQAEFADFQAPENQPAADPDPIMPKSHLEYVVVIRALAMVIIIAEHVIFPQINNYNTIHSMDWWIASTMYLIGKTGSPLFTMISGLLLLNPKKADQPISTFFQKRFIKVLIPFAAWSGIYMLYRLYWLGEQLPADYIKFLLIRGPVYGHLWFLQMILGLYLVTPILRIYVKAASRQNMTYFLIIWYITTSLFPVFDRYVGVEIGIRVVVTTGYVGFFILGIYLRDVKLEGKHLRWAMYGVGLIWTFSQFIVHYGTVANNGRFEHFYAMNTSYNIIPLSILYFLVLKSINWTAVYEALPSFKWSIKKISVASLGIYCVHQMIIDEFRNGNLGFVLDETFANFFISVPVVTAVVMLISAVIILEMQKVPILNKIVP